MRNKELITTLTVLLVTFGLMLYYLLSNNYSLPKSLLVSMISGLGMSSISYFFVEESTVELKQHPKHQ